MQTDQNQFSVNAGTALDQSTEKTHFLVDQMHYWPKVHNICALFLDLQNILFDWYGNLGVVSGPKKLPKSENVLKIK